MKTNTTCLTPEILERLEHNELTADALREIEAHVATCKACSETFDAAFHGSGWSDDIRPALLEAMEVDCFNTNNDSDSALHADIDRLLGPTDDPGKLGRIGSYEVAGVIGRGGMGVVFRAFDANLDRFVAIKMLAPHLASSGAARQRFVREGKAAAAVVDDHVMPVYAVDEWQGVPYLVMQYTRGRSLQQRINDQGPLELKEVLRIGIQVARGLAAAHAQGLVHRDIKPSNILLSETVERAMLMDFGLARAVDDASMTRTGTIAGTPQYMSPEQARAESIDQRSDLFSLGSVLYAMCAGRPPFRGDSAVAVLKKICDEEPRAIAEVNSDIPPWLCEVIRRLMSKSTEQRFGSAEEVADLLEECLAHVQHSETTPLPTALKPRQDAGWLSRAVQSVRPAKPSRGHLTGGGARITEFLAVAAALPLIIALGIIIKLELDKGTLTISSEADNVPIRIMQGDEVVETLTVSTDGTSVRVAAGKYRIVIDGPMEGLTVDKDIITVQRRDSNNVRLVRTESLSSTDDPLISSGERPIRPLLPERKFIPEEPPGEDSAFMRNLREKFGNKLAQLMYDAVFDSAAQEEAGRNPGYIRVDLYCGSGTAMKPECEKLLDRLHNIGCVTTQLRLHMDANAGEVLFAIVRGGRGADAVVAIAENETLPSEAVEAVLNAAGIRFIRDDVSESKIQGGARLNTMPTLEELAKRDLDVEAAVVGMATREGDHITIDFYCGKDTLAEMNTEGPHRDRYNRMALALGEIDCLEINYRVVPMAPANEILAAVIRDPFEVEKRTAVKTSDSQTLIEQINPIISSAGVELIWVDKNGEPLSLGNSMPTEKLRSLENKTSTSVTGLVTAVNNLRVEMSVGSDDAVTVGSVATVYRNTQAIAKLRVIAVTQDKSFGRLLIEQGNISVKKGDSVVFGQANSQITVTTERKEPSLVGRLMGLFTDSERSATSPQAGEKTIGAGTPATDRKTPHVVSETGSWKLEDGVTLTIGSRQDEAFGEVSRATLSWSETESRPALKHEIDIASDEHYKWAVAWEEGRSLLWLLAKGNYQSGSSIRSVNYSCPANIVTAVGYGDDRFDLRLPALSRLQEVRRTPFSIGSPWVRLPKELDRELVQHFGLGKPTFGISSLLPTGPHMPGGEYAESAILKTLWSFHGTVRDAKGKPIAGANVFATTAWSRTVKIAEAVSDHDGNYALDLSLDLMTFAQSRRVVIEAEYKNEQIVSSSALEFDLHLRQDEDPLELLDGVLRSIELTKTHLPKHIRLSKSIHFEEQPAARTIPTSATEVDFRLTPSTIKVEGAVNRPGRYSYPEGRIMNVLDAIALAGGLTNGAGRIVTVTAGTSDRKVKRFEALHTDQLKLSHHLQPGDVVTVKMKPR